MNKRMRELQNLILTETKQAEALLSGENVTEEDVAKANAILDKVDTYQKEFEAQERIEKAKKAGVPTEDDPADTQKGAGKGEGEAKDATKAFLGHLRNRFKDMSEGSKVDGGYTVPEDVSTRVEKYKEERFSLRSLIDYEHVETMSGRRTYQTRAQHTGFTKIAEGGKITKLATPQFEIQQYQVEKFGGFIPVTNELLADSDAAIMSILVEWLGEEELATENAQVLALVKEKAATALTGLKDIKTAVTVTLSAFAGSVRIVTNADGINYLDTLEDKNGRPLLSPDPNTPMQLALSIGARRIPVDPVPNGVLPTTDSKIPFVMGDLKAYGKMYDRKLLTLDVSTTASVGDLNAYEQDLTLIRALERSDWKVKDAEAIVYGELTVA